MDSEFRCKSSNSSCDALKVPWCWLPSAEKNECDGEYESGSEKKSRVPSPPKPSMVNAGTGRRLSNVGNGRGEDREICTRQASSNAELRDGRCRHTGDKARASVRGRRRLQSLDLARASGVDKVGSGVAASTGGRMPVLMPFTASPGSKLLRPQVAFSTTF